MSNPGQRRLMKEFKRLQLDPPPGFCADLQDNDISHWNALILGPENSPWNGGLFKLTLQCTERYPSDPPNVRFVSRMFHPNIYADGSICVNILQDGWTPALTLTAVLKSIQSLLCDPNPNSAANPEAAVLFTENRAEYNRRVREIVEQSLT